MFAAIGSSTAYAQTPNSSGLDCSMFHHNNDGSWSPNAPMTMRSANGAINLSPGVSFRSGVAFMGVDLGAALDANCH